MSRNLDSTMSAHLADGVIYPAFFASFQFRSGVTNAWSGVGPFTWGGLTFQGVGTFGEISAITEGTDVQADGMTVQIANLPFTDAAPTAASIPSPYQNAAFNTAAPGACSVTLSVTAGDLLLALCSNDGYAVTAPTLPSIADDQGNSWVTDSSTLQGWIGGTGCGFLLAHTTAQATGNVTVTVTPYAGCGTRLLVVDTNANSIDGAGIAAGSIVSGPLTPSASASSNEAALVLDFEGSNEWFSSEGTQLYTQHTGGNFAHVWEYTATEGTNTVTVTASAADNFPAAALVTLANPPGTPILAIQEDIQSGAPAKLWFGLLDSTGALLGTPYLIFSGIVDQPTIDVDTETFTTALALENRLTNLQRPSGRRYTAADQRLFYPDDSGFNFVELLNDIALRWGS